MSVFLSQEFNSIDNMFAGIVMSGHFDSKRTKFLSHIHHGNLSADTKIDEFNKYLMINLIDCDNIMKSGALRDKNAQFATRYIDAASENLLGSLVNLCDNVFGKEMSDQPRGPSEWSFWQTESIDPFCFYSWEHNELQHRMNSDFFLLAPMNFKLFTEMKATYVAHRLGGKQPGWKRIGMLNSVMDAGGLLPYKGDMRMTTKSTGSGLDHTRECFYKV